VYRVPADGDLSTTKPVEMRLFYSGADITRWIEYVARKIASVTTLRESSVAL
jgi:hypothetical protein